VTISLLGQNSSPLNSIKMLVKPLNAVLWLCILEVIVTGMLGEKMSNYPPYMTDKIIQQQKLVDNLYWNGNIVDAKKAENFLNSLKEYHESGEEYYVSH